MKKPNSGPAGKIGTGKSGVTGRSSGSMGSDALLGPKKVTSGKSSTLIPNRTTPSTSATGKSFSPTTFTTPKSNKSSSTFGFIWLPSRKHNKKKEIVYNSHRNDHYKDRGPSMYNFIIATNMQENNFTNFQKIISQWRRLSGEQVESAALISMSGDTPHQSNNKMEEDGEKDLLVPGKMQVALAGASATAVEPVVTSALSEEKQIIDSIKDKEETKGESGDAPSKEKEKDSTEYLEHNDSMDKSSDSKWENDKEDKGDKVDSVYLRPPPPHKARSNTSSPPAEQEDCGITCLYYTLQCCDCVLM